MHTISNFIHVLGWLTAFESSVTCCLCRDDWEQTLFFRICCWFSDKWEKRKSRSSVYSLELSIVLKAWSEILKRSGHPRQCFEANQGLIIILHFLQCSGSWETLKVVLNKRLAAYSEALSLSCLNVIISYSFPWPGAAKSLFITYRRMWAVLCVSSSDVTMTGHNVCSIAVSHSVIWKSNTGIFNRCLARL